MARIKTKELQHMGKEERDKKLEELKMELIKARINASKTGNSKVREIKRLIARLLTLDRNKELKK